MEKYKSLVPAAFFCIAMACLLGTIISMAALAEKSEKTQTNPRIWTSPEDCQKDVVRRFKKNKKLNSKAELAQCMKLFPLAMELTHCQQDALKLKVTNPKQSKDQLTKCRTEYELANPSSKNPLPFAAVGQSTFFFGWPMEKDASIERMIASGWECSDLREAMENQGKRHFDLMGNDPRVFSKLKVITNPKVIKKFGKKGQIKNEKEKFIDLPGIGRLFPDHSNKEPLIFFGTGVCRAHVDPDSAIQSANLHFLIDSQKKLRPFYGVVFYKEPKTALKANAGDQRLQKSIGSRVKPQKPRPFFQLYANTVITSFDKEGDPKNVCLSPRKLTKVGVLRQNSSEPTAAQYIVVANINNLCEYGDLLDPKSILTR